MTQEFERIFNMLHSEDDDMVNLGSTAFSKVCDSWSLYNSLREEKVFRDLPNESRKMLRKGMIENHGRTRTKYKRW